MADASQDPNSGAAPGYNSHASRRWEKRTGPMARTAAEGANARNRSGPYTAVGSHSGETDRPEAGAEPAPKGQEASGVILPRPAL